MQAEVAPQLPGTGGWALHASHRQAMRRVLLLLLVLAAIQLLVWLIPATPGDRGVQHYLFWHALMETVSIVIAMMVFAVGWNSHGGRTPGNLAILACMFFVIGSLDFSHTMAYGGMPDFLTPNGPDKHLNFWLLARLLAALSLLIVGLRNWDDSINKAGRIGLVLGTLGFNLLVIYHQDAMPNLFVPGQGLTALKKDLEYLTIATNGVTALVLWRRMRSEQSFNAPLLFAAVGIMAMSEFYFTLYATMTGAYNVMGHIYKVLSYLFIYRAVVVVAIEQPYVQLVQAQDELQLAVQASNTGLWHWHIASNQTSYSPVWKAQLGYAEHELENAFSTWERLLHPDDRAQAVARAFAYLNAADGLNYESEFRMRHKDGSYHWILARGEKQQDRQGRTVRLLGSHTDISTRVLAEERINQLIHFDSLTGLPNRHLLHERVNQAIQAAATSRRRLAILFIDIDHFKHVNDTLGHRVGDKLLVDAGKRLQSSLSAGDTVARIGGDEFVVVLAEGAGEAAAVAAVAKKLMATISRPYRIDTHELAVTPSIGVAIYPDDGPNFDSLYQHADTAMYRAKQDGRNDFRFFTRDMQYQTARVLQLESAMHHVLERNELYLLYQPQRSMDGAQVIGVEALLRWKHPELGMVSPAEFIPLAESNGQIIPIGAWVLRTAMHQLKAWMDAGLPPMVMAVNVSAVQFRHINLPGLVSEILSAAQVPPEYLELELTEGVAMGNPMAAVAVMDKLHARGVRMSIDDFGTGYSSLSYLKRFNVYKLKIDQSFVRDIASDADDRAIVTAIIQMAHSLGFKTIAEGVETEDQRNFLAQQGCDEMQGYLFSKPVSAAEVHRMCLPLLAA